jgi:enamine deaminase RidA (YjgF/YER057c/UK114 family)
VRQNISSGTHWELEIGYSRLVKVGPMIFVSGTTSVDENGNIVGIGDSFEQAKFIIRKIEKSLKEVNATLLNVVRTRIFTTNIEDWTLIGEAYAEFFLDIKPASTMVEVKRLINPELRVEIEADAILIEPDDNKQGF